MRKIVLTVFLLLLVLGFTQAARVGGFRDAYLEDNRDGYFYSSAEVPEVNLTIYANGRLISDAPQFTRSFQVDYLNGSFKYSWNFTVNNKNLLDNVLNVTLVVKGIQRPYLIGSGLLCFPRERYVTNEFNQPIRVEACDLFAFGDMYSQLAFYNLLTNESVREDGAFEIVLTNFSRNMPLQANKYFAIDPTISEYGETSNPFGFGVFQNNTYLNGSQSVQTVWFANNFSFAGNGTFYSQGIVLNRTGLAWVNYVNWSWFEAIGFAVNESPVISMHFENDTKDSSRFNNSGWRINVSGMPFNSSCKIGGCFSFESQASQNNYINISDSPILRTNITETFTVAAWVNKKADFGAASSYQLIASKVTAISVGGWELALDSGRLRYAFRNASGTYDSGAITPYIRNNSWEHIVFTFNSTHARLYVNGSLIHQSPSLNIQYNDHAPFQWGARTGVGSNRLNGSIDEAHFWANISLTQAQVSQLYAWENAGQPITNFTNVSIAFRAKNATFNFTDLLLYFDLGDSTDNETVGLRTVDLSGNGRYGQLGNSSSTTRPKVNTTALKGKSLWFDGQDDFILVNPFLVGTVNLTAQNLTMMAWVRGTTTVTGKTALALTEQAGSNSRFWLDSALGKLQINFRNATGTTILTAQSAQTVYNTSANWNLVGVRKNGTHAQMFINGYPDGALNLSSAGVIGSVLFDQLSIGYVVRNQVNCPSSCIGTQPFEGNIDEVFVFNRSLTDAEMLTMFNRTQQFSSNWSEFTTPLFGKNRIVPNTLGNVIQYKADFYSTSTNYSAFLRNVSITYNPEITAYIDQYPYFLDQTGYSSNGTACLSQLVAVWANATDDIGLSIVNSEVDYGDGIVQFGASYDPDTPMFVNESYATNTTPNSRMGVRWKATDAYSQVNYTQWFNWTSIDCIGVNYSSYGVNTTATGALARFNATFLENDELANYTFSYDNGGGSFVNETGTITGKVNVTNATRTLPSITSTVRWFFTACDRYGNCNSTPIQTIAITVAAVSYTPRCDDGSYLLTGNNQYWYYETNGHPVHQCSFSIWRYNQTTPIKIFGFVNMTENTTSDWHNASFDLTGLTTLEYDFYAMVNCSFGGNVETHSEILGLVNSCASTMVLNNGSVNNNMEVTALALFALFALVVYALGSFTNNRGLKLVGFMIGVIFAFFVWSGAGIQTPVVNQNSTIDTSTATITVAATTTTNYVNVKNSWTDYLALIIFAVCLLFGVNESLLWFMEMYKRRGGGNG